MRFSKCCRNIHGAVCSTCCLYGVVVMVRPETLQGIIKFDLAAIVAPEMKCWIKSTRHRYEIAGYFPLRNDPPLTLAIGGDFNRGNA